MQRAALSWAEAVAGRVGTSGLQEARTGPGRRWERQGDGFSLVLDSPQPSALISWGGGLDKIR